MKSRVVALKFGNNIYAEPNIPDLEFTNSYDDAFSTIIEWWRHDQVGESPFWVIHKSLCKPFTVGTQSRQSSQGCEYSKPPESVAMAYITSGQKLSQPPHPRPHTTKPPPPLPVRNLRGQRDLYFNKGEIKSRKWNEEKKRKEEKLHPTDKRKGEKG